MRLSRISRRPHRSASPAPSMDDFAYALTDHSLKRWPSLLPAKTLRRPTSMPLRARFPPAIHALTARSVVRRDSSASPPCIACALRAGEVTRRTRTCRLPERHQRAPLLGDVDPGARHQEEQTRRSRPRALVSTPHAHRGVSRKGPPCAILVIAPEMSVNTSLLLLCACGRR